MKDMTKDREQIDRLVRMAGMILEAQGLRLRGAARARDAVRAQIDGLDRPAPEEVAADPAFARAACAYAIWASSRRQELNLALARHEAQWLNGLDEARRAFGRQRILERMAAASGRGRSGTS